MNLKALKLWEPLLFLAMPFTKQQLRSEYLHKRSVLPQAEYNTYCNKLLNRFKSLNLNEVAYLHLFLPILKHKEPDTFLIRDWLKAIHPEIQLVYPKTNFADCTMQSFLDNENLQLDINKFGITEPQLGDEVAPEKIDLILVPLLAFDKQGYRVGYGKGFYDRFITQCRTDVELIGLSFFDAVDQIIDLDQYDKPLTKCITPEKIYNFNL